ncbi:PAP2-domain-containing protein [Daedaleopsis nitida]|nr:PAP2-domain-containing protein [Daedaleopsis nitida]
MSSSYEDYSRASTPDSAAALEVNFRKADVDRNWNEKPENVAAAHAAMGVEEDTALLVGAAGRQPEEVYTRTLSWWRAVIRRAILRNVERESKWLANMQDAVRHPVLDAYFVYTSSLGTHTFFMIMLPIFFFFGAPESGRGLLVTLAVGVYVSSFIKDLCCAPRPYAPPVTRLTIGSHHLEYGFPSTHSTNSVSIALFFYDLLQRAYGPASTIAKSAVEHAASSVNATPGILPSAKTILEVESPFSQTTYQLAVAALVFYVFSIVYGRLYTGMHSFTDCAFGITLGAGLWRIHISFGGYVDAWVRDNGFIVPALIIPLCLYLVHRHPQPVDDCPCFEDAIAFVSVVMGEFVMRWFMLHNGYDETFFTRSMPGSSWATWSDVGTWWSTAGIKMVIGILTIFIWRIAAKSFCHFVLPPTFRLLSHLFTLPHRRFYTPATDYTSVPAEKGLRPIPSVIDLPRMVEYEVDGVGVSAAVRRNGPHGAIKQRGGRAKQEVSENEQGPKNEKISQWWAEPGEKARDVKHYDADVLTKVFVSSGIGVVATGVVPVMFEVLGWGVKTS